MIVHVTAVRVIGGEMYAILEPIPIRRVALTPGTALEVTVLPATSATRATAAATRATSAASSPGATSAASSPASMCGPNCPMRKVAEIVIPFVRPIDSGRIRPDQEKEDVDVLG